MLCHSPLVGGGGTTGEAVMGAGLGGLVGIAVGDGASSVEK